MNPDDQTKMERASYPGTPPVYAAGYADHRADDCPGTRSDKELSVRSLVIRKIIHLLLIEGAVILIALNADTIPTEKSWVLPGLALGIFAVFVLTHIILYLINKKDAEKLNADLSRYQERQMNGSPIHE